MTTEVSQTRNVILQPRDIELFLALQQFPYLSQHYLGELLGFKKTTAVQNDIAIIRYNMLRRRLRLLRLAGYIRIHPDSKPRKGAKDRPRAYMLTIEGKNVLKARGLYSPSYRLTSSFNHDFGSCLIVASMKLGVLKDPTLRLIEAPEIIGHPSCPSTTREATEPFALPLKNDKAKKHDWAPWGIGFAYANGKERKIFFPGHEFDCDSEGLRAADKDRSSIEHHLRTILELLNGGYKAHFGITSMYPLIVATSPERLKKMMALLLEMTKGKGSEKILFDFVDDYTNDGPFPPATDFMLTRPKQRAGYPPFDILEALGAKEKEVAA